MLKTSAADLITVIVSALVGGSGLCGLVFFFIRRYIENALNERKQEDEINRKNRERRALIERRLKHAETRVIFWIVRAIETGEHNGELKGAFEDMQRVEKEMKELDYEILTINEME